eukprot:3735-Pelagomonas_calceolata.AAC.3
MFCVTIAKSESYWGVLSETGGGQSLQGDTVLNLMLMTNGSNKLRRAPKEVLTNMIAKEGKWVASLVACLCGVEEVWYATMHHHPSKGNRALEDGSSQQVVLAGARATFG